MKRKEIVALTGARQIGKTTIMKYFFDKINNPKKEIITFENIEILNLFETNIELFIERYVKNNNFLFIDEIQYSENSGKLLKYIYDTSEIKIVISGSSKSEIAINSLQFLVGRVLIVNIYPINFYEYLIEKDKENSFLLEKKRTQKDFKLINESFSNYLKYGGYPEVVLTENIELKKDILSNILNTYLLKEIRDVLNYKNLNDFREILTYIALNDGSILNVNSIANDFNIYNKKIRDIILTLENTTILNIVKPYLKNKTKELIKSPKIYLFDLGFKNSLIKNFNDINLKLDKGSIYENFILNSLVKLNIEVRYWNYRNNYEMDFVVENNGKLIGLEVKSKLNNMSLTKSMKKFIEIEKPNKIYVFCENQEGIIEYQNCVIEFTNYLNIFYIINKEIN